MENSAKLKFFLSRCKCKKAKVITNGLKCNSDDVDGLTNGRKMAPVLGVPPPPPPAPHMGPDGLILPRKPYNPCLISTNHKDLHRELLFNQKIGKNVLNQKSELQRALEKQREAASRREAERIREESYKDDPRTALQRAIEQRARNIQLTQEQSQATQPPSNLLITARAKLRPRTESQ
nr:PREDICTED: protein FAM107B isoform X2 [Linepithema humile]